VFGLRVRLLRTELVLGLGADAAMLISSASVGGGQMSYISAGNGYLRTDRQTDRQNARPVSVIVLCRIKTSPTSFDT